MKLKPQALLLDDDAFFRKALEVVLTGLGMNVKTVANIADFYTELSLCDPDLLLIDIQLGKENGLILVEELRAKGNPTPIVVISGDHNPATTSHALEIGANDYILKPFDKLLLANKLAQFVNTQELDDQTKFLNPVDGKKMAAKILLNGGILEVDELGIRFFTAHLVPKGAVVKLSGPFIGELSGGKEECVVCVTQTQLNAKKNGYEIYAEFEGVEVEFLQAVRKWISGKKKSLAA